MSWYGMFSYEFRFIFKNSDKFEIYASMIYGWISANYSRVTDIKIMRSLSQANDDSAPAKTYSYITDKTPQDMSAYLYNLSLKEDLRRVSYRGADYEKYIY